jgi:hypothetical protein
MDLQPEVKALGSRGSRGWRMGTASAMEIGVDGDHGRERPFPRFLGRIGRHRPAQPEMGKGMVERGQRPRPREAGLRVGRNCQSERR